MRLEYGFQLNDVDVPCFAVEAIEGIGKLFTLATLIMNVLETRERVEIVFHGLNPDDPDNKIAAFEAIAAGSEHPRNFEYLLGAGGHIPGSSSYFRWVTITRS